MLTTLGPPRPSLARDRTFFFFALSLAPKTNAIDFLKNRQGEGRGKKLSDANHDTTAASAGTGLGMR